MSKDEKKININNENKTMIEDIKQDINKEFGAGSVFTKNENKKNKNIATISTGSILLDEAVGNGGFVSGRIIEIFGPESSGKTTLCLHAVKESQKKGGIAAFIDVEHAIDMSYAEKIGVDIDKLLVCQPNSGEEALGILESLAKKNVNIIILDSVAALVTRAEIEGNMGDTHIGLQARLMSQALKKITSIISKSGTMVIFTNQLRNKIGVMYGSPETTCGGNALKFYASVRIDMRRKEYLKQGDNIVGIKVLVKIIKNKCASPFKEALITIMYSIGITILNEILNLSIQFNLITRGGSWYTIGENKFAGENAILEYLRQNTKIKQDLKMKIYKILEEKSNFIDNKHLEDIKNSEENNTDILNK
jgi:recombination protein RecA